MKRGGATLWLAFAALIAACGTSNTTAPPTGGDAAGGADATGADAADSPDSTGSSSGSSSSGGTLGDAASPDASDATPGDGESDRSAIDARGDTATDSPADSPTDSAIDSAIDAGADAGPCGTCGLRDDTQVCVEHFAIGGGFLPPDDAGRCPAGQMVLPESQNICITPPTFTCETLPSACFPVGSARPANCVCAPSICPRSQNTCIDVSPTLMRCIFSAP